MTNQVRCMALRAIKYSDSSSIGTLWTDQLGRLSVALPSGTGREAQRRRAIMMPLGVFDAVVERRPGREIARIHDLRPVTISPAACPDPAKGVVAMFLSDFLYAVLRESPPDARLSQYLFESMAWLAAAQGTAMANFHLYFLYHLGRFLGIEPDMGTYAPGRCFDLREGAFAASRPLHALVLEPPQAAAVALLARMHPRNLHLVQLSHTERNEILDRMLDYYSLHLAPLNTLPSLAIVRDIFR